MAPRTRATAPRPPPAAVPAPRQTPPPPAARRRRQGLHAPPGRAASGRPEEELQEGPGALATPESGAERPGGLPAQHGPGRERRREGAPDGSPPARKARVTPAASSLAREVNRPVTTGFRKLKKRTQANTDMGNENTIDPTRPAAPLARKARATAASLAPIDPMSSTLPANATIKNPASKVNRPVTRSISKSARANAAVANVDNDTTDTRIRTDDIESLRRRLIASESEVVKEKDNVRRGLEHIRRKDAQILEITNFYQETANKLCTTLERAFETIDLLIEVKVSLQKLKAEKEAEILELKVQKEAEILELKVQKEAEILEFKVQKEAEILELQVEKQAEVLKGLHKEAEVQEVIKEKIRLLHIVDKKEAQLQAMSEHCKLLALKNTTVAADTVR